MTPPPRATETPSLRRAREIDGACDRFERAWRAAGEGGVPPVLGDFLRGEPAGRDSGLAPELLAIELHYRRRRGEQPRVEDYAGLTIALDPAWFLTSDDVMTSTPSIGAGHRTFVEGNKNAAPGYGGELPRRFAGYDLLEEVARGGMGVVYRARHALLGREVALKMILAGELASPEEVERFRAEAQAAAGLDHPNIVPVYEVGSHDGRHYYTMKLIEGKSLREYAPELLDKPRDIALLMAQVAEAVQYAHSKAVLHRDIKPANILLGPQEDHTTELRISRGATDTWHIERVNVYVTDFGLAKRLEGATDQTRSDALLGTPAYMSPEQASGGARRVGTASDLYSLGAVLYQLLTGRTPFVGDDILSLLSQVANAEPPPPSSLRSGVPRDLETICLKCLRKEPHERYASAAALADDLRRYEEGKPITARPVGRGERLMKWVKRKPAVASLAAGVMLVALLAAGLVLWQWHEAVYQESQKGEALSHAQKSLASMRRSDYFQRIARADLELATNNAHAAEQLLDTCPPDLRDWEWSYLKGQCHTELLRISAHLADATVVRFSPDGRRLATGGFDGKVHVWALPGGECQVTIDFPSETVRSVHFHPDGQKLFISGGDWTKPRGGAGGIWNAVTGSLIAPLEGVEGNIWRLATTKDGSVLAGTQGRSVWLWDSETGKKLKSIAVPVEALSVAISPDDKILAIGLRNGEIEMVSLDGTLPTTKLGADGDSEIRDLAFSQDGSQLASSSFQGNVRLWLLSSRRYTTAHRDLQRVETVAFSPDGRFLATGLCNGSVIILGATGSKRCKQLRSFSGHAREALRVHFSPNGRLLASVGWDGVVRIWDMSEPPPLPESMIRSGMHTLMPLPDGDHFVTGSKPLKVFDTYGHIAVWDKKGNLHYILDRQKAGYDGLALNGEAGLIAAASGRQIALWNLSSRQRVCLWTAHDSDITALCYLPETHELVTAARDGTVRLWPFDGSVPGQPRQGWRYSTSVTYLAAQGSRLAVGIADGKIEVWDCRSGVKVDSWAVHTGPVYALAFHPNLPELASGGADRSVRIRDLATATSITTVHEHLAPVTGLAYNSRGTRLVSASLDNQLAFSDANTGELVLTFRRHILSPVTVKFSSDDQRLMALQGPHLAGNVRFGTSQFRIWDTSNTAASRQQRLLEALNGR